MLPEGAGSNGRVGSGSCGSWFSFCRFCLGSCVMGFVKSVGCDVSIIVIVTSLKRCEVFRWCRKPLCMIVSHWLQTRSSDLVVGEGFLV